MERTLGRRKAERPKKGRVASQTRRKQDGKREMR